jgi:mannosyltransferase
VPWLVLPPAVLFAVSAVKPVYYLPYVLFCLPAAALLGGAFLAGLSGPARAATAALAAALVIPAQIAIRVPGSGGALWPADQILAAGAQPGDAIIYPQGGIPPWDLAYADGFGRLRNIGQAEPGAATGRLYGVSVPRSLLLHRECGVRRVWVAEIGPQWRSLSGYLAPGFRLAGQWEPFGAAMRLWLYQQSGAAGGPDGACCC